ncbi:uncharacterized protein LOC105830080 [Monomorium pharaonis]|uniref:uncharacterized protein LOC105830080 n=1 Tax=Monomorium pharaonis TaxID=307658 RepID=UPI00063FC015|nr:uncharacterized protein LOC105830080 [Monomorium pharaonis]
MQRQNLFAVTIFVVVIFSTLHSSKALTCYGSLPNASYTPILCEYPLDGSCVKFTNKLTTDLRGCAIKDFCETQKSVYKFSSCYECHTDLCNASAKNMVSAITIITSGLLALFWSIQ